jgi:polyisoprenoid-binding protein YceI
MRLRIFALALLFVPFTTWAAPSSLEVKSASIEWISDAPVEKIIGTAEGKGSLKVDFADLSTITGTITVAVNSMKTGNEKRDQHLQGPEWLDGAQFPEITFTIKSVKVTGAPTGDAVKTAVVEATGDFSLHGKSQPLTTSVTLKWKGSKVKIKTKFEVSLDDFAIEGKKGLVGNKVGKTIAISAAFKGKAN